MDRRLLATLMGLVLVQPVAAQLAPEIGYVQPKRIASDGGMEVLLGGYDWTPDMQILSHDPRVKIELQGPPSRVLVPEPPYWFGAKARGPAWPLPREFSARISMPRDASASFVRWQVANANGVSPPATFYVSPLPLVVDAPDRRSPQILPELPVSIAGQIRKIEEIDAYQFRVATPSLVTLSLIARRIGSPLHGMLRVHDGAGRVLVDLADTEGRDLTTSFAAAANTDYIIRLHDLDYAGDRSYVYRLELTTGPRIVATFPACGKRGTTQRIELVGWGLTSGTAQIETLSREVTFPAEGTAHMVVVETPQGTASRSFPLVENDELVEPAGARGMPLPSAPMAVTGAIEQTAGADEFTVALAKGSAWRISAQSCVEELGLDLELAILGSDGKELTAQDDAQGATDPVLDFSVPADGTYRLVVAERSGRAGSRAACYHLAIEPQREDFTATVPSQLSIPVGGQAKLAVPVVRLGGLKSAVRLMLEGLPAGIQAPGDLVIPGDKNELAIELNCLADAPAAAGLVTVRGVATLAGQEVTRPLGKVAMASILKPRCKITPEGLDDVRKVHRGSTYLAPLLIERLEGYSGPITLEMTSKQQRHRQGLASDEFVVRPDAKRVEYPIFVPEWMETTKTSRMILNGTVQVPDPKGNLRTLVQKMELRIGILPEGALLTLTHGAGEPVVAAGDRLAIPVFLARAPELKDSVKIEIVSAPESVAGAVPPVWVNDDRAEIRLNVPLVERVPSGSEHEIVIRATALQHGQWPVMAETKVAVSIR